MIIRGIIISILTVALTLVSYGHQSLSPETEAQAQAYILAGGDWAELCGDGDDPLAHATKCMACLIGQACALPKPTQVARQTPTSVAMHWAIAAADHATAAPYSLQTARAPPFVSSKPS